MGKLHFTEEGKKNLMNYVKETANQTGNQTVNQKKVFQFSNLLKVSVIVATLCLTSITAYATGILRPVGEVLAPLLGQNQAQTEIIEKIGRPIGASDTSNGVTITAEAIIGDRQSTIVVYTVANEDGSAFTVSQDQNLEDIFFHIGDSDTNNGTQLAHNGEWSSGGLHVMVDEQGSLMIMERLQTGGELPFGTVVPVRFGAMQYYDVENGITTLVDGTWEFEYLFDYEDSSVQIEVHEEFEKDGITTIVENIHISPIALCVKYQMDGLPQLKFIEPSMEGATDMELVGEGVMKIEEVYFCEAPIFLNKQDGTSMELAELSSFLGEASRTETREDGTITYIAETNGVFDEIIPLDEIVSITVGEIEVFMP